MGKDKVIERGGVVQLGEIFTHENGRKYKTVIDEEAGGEMCVGCAFDNDITGCINSPECGSSDWASKTFMFVRAE